MKPLISPILFLGIMLAMTALAWVAHRLLRLGHRRGLRRLARLWQMHYAEADLFDIAGRIAADLPVIGGADLRVLDIIYASDERYYCYIFTAEYTRGVVERQRRESRVMSLREAKDAPHAEHHRPQVAPQDLGLLRQYESLKAVVWPGPGGHG